MARTRADGEWVRKIPERRSALCKCRFPRNAVGDDVFAAGSLWMCSCGIVWEYEGKMGLDLDDRWKVNQEPTVREERNDHQE